MARDKSRFATQSEYARHRGVSRQYIGNLKKNERLVTSDDGFIDIAATDAALGAGETQGEPPASRQAASPVSSGLQQARLHDLAYRAQNRKLDYEKRIGEVLARDDVRKAYMEIGRVVGAQRAQLPAQLAAKVIGKTDVQEIEQIIRHMLKDADERAAREIARKFTHVAEVAA